MSKHPLLLLVSLIAVCAVALPSVATAGNGGGYGGYNGCDHYAPHSGWGHDWWGRDGGGRYWRGWNDGDGYFGGQASDRGCYGGGGGYSLRRTGKVDRVMVAVKRLRSDGRCQSLYRSGFLGRPGDCATTHWMRARGSRNWRFVIPRNLPAGRYRLHRRAVDAAGNREHTRRLHLRIH